MTVGMPPRNEMSHQMPVLESSATIRALPSRFKPSCDRVRCTLKWPLKVLFGGAAAVRQTVITLTLSVVFNCIASLICIRHSLNRALIVCLFAMLTQSGSACKLSEAFMYASKQM